MRKGQDIYNKLRQAVQMEALLAQCVQRRADSLHNRSRIGIL